MSIETNLGKVPRLKPKAMAIQIEDLQKEVDRLSRELSEKHKDFSTLLAHRNELVTKLNMVKQFIENL